MLHGFSRSFLSKYLLGAIIIFSICWLQRPPYDSDIYIYIGSLLRAIMRLRKQRRDRNRLGAAA